MANVDFFIRLGLFVQNNFLDSEFCHQCVAEARSSTATPAQVFHKDTHTGIISHIVDASIRKTEEVKLSKPAKLHIQQRLLDLKPNLEHHFQVALATCEKPLFYLYGAGSFFGPHIDCLSAPDTTGYEHAKDRRVSVIVFLNRQSPDAQLEGYGGGALTLYGLINQPQWQDYGFPFMGEPGMLVAFRSNLLHEVKPVTHGERYTVVSWFS